MSNLHFRSVKKTFIIVFFLSSLLSCKTKSTTQIGEIHSNDAYSNKIAELLKAFEAKDSATFSSMYADDFKLLNETVSGWVDNDYFKDTSKGTDKKSMIDAECANLRELNDVKYENPNIISYFFQNADTITIVKAYFTAVEKTSKSKIRNPYYRIFKWKNGKISETLKYTNKTGSNVNYNYYGGYENYYGSYEVKLDSTNQNNKTKDSTKTIK